MQEARNTVLCVPRHEGGAKTEMRVTMTAMYLIRAFSYRNHRTVKLGGRASYAEATAHAKVISQKIDPHHPDQFAWQQVWVEKAGKQVFAVTNPLPLVEVVE